MIDPHWQNQIKRNEWIGGTKHHEALVLQGKEAAEDLVALSGCKSFLDVGGAAGRIGEFLKQYKPEGSEIEYRNIDLENGFDITKPWDEQGLTENFDVVFTNLTLICFDENDVEFIAQQMYKHATKYIYLFEEKSITKFACGFILAVDKGMKYNHLWANHFWPMKSRLDSKVHPEAWERILIQVKNKK